MEYRIQKIEETMPSQLSVKSMWRINMKTIIAFIFITITLFTGGCSGDKSNTNENVFKEETRAIDKAKRVEAEVMKQAEQQKQAIEQQTQQ